MLKTDKSKGKDLEPAPDFLARRVAVELGVLVSMTAMLVLLFPQRPAWVNALLAALGLALILMNRQFTRAWVWQRFPVPYARRYCIVYTLLATGWFTLGGGILLAVMAWWQDSLSGLQNPRWLLALPIYFLWGLLQQYLFQVYLLGRLLVLMPVPWAIAGTGLAFALVHFPHAGTMVVTLAAGLVWTTLYYRYRVLMPLAASHAVLGSVLFYGLYGRDILAHWGLL